MAKKLNFINIFLNNSKNSCLSLIKFLKRRKLPLHNVNSEKIDTSAGNSTFNGDDDFKMDLNWCLGQLSNGHKIIFVLYANDFQPCVQQQLSREAIIEAAAARVPVSVSAVHHQSSSPIFQLKLINVQDEEKQLSVVSQVLRRQSMRLPLQQLSALVCILISSKMTYLINTITNNTESEKHPMKHWLAHNHSTVCTTDGCNGPQATDSDGDGELARATFACYDELNEINMFQVKYKLIPGTTYIATDNANLHEDIQRAARRLCNEALYQSYSLQSHSQQQQYLNLAVKQSKKPMFKVFPKQIHETSGQVLLSLNEAITSDQQLDVLLNGCCPFDQFSVKWRNASTLCFTVPDRFLNDCKQVDISVVINCTTWLGTRTIKCDRKAPIDCGNFISSENSAHSLCTSQGAQSVKKLDTNLPKVLIESLLNLQPFPPDIDDKTNQLLPTWLKEVVMRFKYPASAQSSIVGRCCDAKLPIDLATEHGHWEVFRILNNYSRQIENSSQEQLIALPRTETASTTVDNTLLHLISTPPCSGHSNVGAKVLSDDLVSTALSTCPANDSGADRILEAKNELLLLIEKFKSGISIESFETIFSDWETKYNDVLEGQMSEELLYSLNQIKMLCALDSISDLDYDDEEEEQCNGSAVDVTKDGDYGEATQESKTQRCSALNELQRTQSTTFAQQMDDDPNGKQLKQLTHAPSHGLIEQCIASHSKSIANGSTTPQVPSTDGHLNPFAIDANRQFSRDLNSINMSDNKVRPEERPLRGSNCQWRSETHQQVTTVSDCQVKCHQFGGLFGPAATTTYISPHTSTHWGQVMQQPTKESISPPESESRHRANPSRHMQQTQWPSVDNNNAGDNTCTGSALHSTEPPPRMAQQAHCRRPRQASSGGGQLVYQPSPSPPTSLIAVRQLTNLPVSHCSEGTPNERQLNQLPTPQTAQLDRTLFSADDRLCRLVDSHGKHDYYQFGSAGGRVAANFATQQALPATKEASADCSFTGKASAAALLANQSLPLVGLVDRRANRSTGALSSGLAGASAKCTSTSGSHYYLIPRSIPVPVSSFFGSSTSSSRQ